MLKVQHMLLMHAVSSWYRQIPKNFDTRKICCNHPKNWTKWLYLCVMCPEDADRMANNVDPDLGLHSLYRPVCPKT